MCLSIIHCPLWWPSRCPLANFFLMIYSVTSAIKRIQIWTHKLGLLPRGLRIFGVTISRSNYNCWWNKIFLNFNFNYCRVFSLWTSSVRQFWVLQNNLSEGVSQIFGVDLSVNYIFQYLIFAKQFLFGSCVFECMLSVIIEYL